MKQNLTFFYVISVLLVLWNTMGIMNFMNMLNLSERTLQNLTTEQRNYMYAIPTWSTILFGLATCGALTASIALFFKQQWVKLIFIVSFILATVNMLYAILFTDALDVFGVGKTIGPDIFILSICILSIVFANQGIKRGILK